jgi:hypothetical protein
MPVRVKEREGHAREGKNAGTNSLQTFGVAAILVIAVCLTYIDEFQPARGKSSFDLINNAHLNDCQMIETEKGIHGSGGQLVRNGKVRLRPCRKQHRLLKQVPPPFMATVLKDCGASRGSPWLTRLFRCWHTRSIPLLAHLEELRKRIIFSVLGAVVDFLSC